jgi:hypothetical protein
MQVRLFLSVSGEPKPACQCVLAWHVVNDEAADELSDFEINLFAGHPEARVENLEYNPARLQRRIGPGERAPLSSSVTPRVEGDYSFDIMLSGRDRSGRVFRFHSVNSWLFSAVRDTQVKMTIEVDEGSGVANARKFASGAGVSEVTIRGKRGSIIDGSSSADLHLNAQASESTDQGTRVRLLSGEGEVEIPLREYAADEGLNPLDLELFSAAWPKGRGGVRVRFVDADGRPRQGTCKLKETYRLQVEAETPGYLTLISQGSSGKYYGIVPNTISGAEAARVRTGVIIHYPGELLPLPTPSLGHTDCIRFNPPAGVERVLAVLTPEPLVIEPWPINLEQGFQRLTEEQVCDLLSRACAMREASVSYAVMNVEQEGPGWMQL